MSPRFSRSLQETQKQSARARIFSNWLRLLVFLEEDKGSDHDVLAARSVGGRAWVDAGGVERPSRDGTVGDGVVTLEHRDFGGLLLGKPVPLVVGAVREASGLADAVVVD